MKWDKMKPEDRNRLVAEKVMGWQAKECDGEIGELPISPDGWYCQRCGYSGSWGDDTTHEERPPHYTQSMDRAWEVVKKMIPEGFMVHYPESYYAFPKHLERLCTADPYDFSQPADMEPRWFYNVTPERVCLAALKAVGVDIE